MEFFGTDFRNQTKKLSEKEKGKRRTCVQRIGINKKTKIFKKAHMRTGTTKFYGWVRYQEECEDPKRSMRKETGWCSRKEAFQSRSLLFSRLTIWRWSTSSRAQPLVYVRKRYGRSNGKNIQEKYGKQVWEATSRKKVRGSASKPIWTARHAAQTRSWVINGAWTLHGMNWADSKFCKCCQAEGTGKTQTEGFRQHMAIDGSFKGISGIYAACGWALVQGAKTFWRSESADARSQSSQKASGMKTGLLFNLEGKHFCAPTGKQIAGVRTENWSQRRACQRKNLHENMW